MLSFLWLLGWSIDPCIPAIPLTACAPKIAAYQPPDNGSPNRRKGGGGRYAQFAFNQYPC